MNEYEKMMSNGLYNALYEKLVEEKFQYFIEEFSEAFKNVASEKKYAYLTYAVAKSETPDLHLLICDLLLYTDLFFYDMYTVQKWHLKRALEISPNNKEVLQWIVDIFSNHPDSPFSLEELSDYNNILHLL